MRRKYNPTSEMHESYKRWLAILPVKSALGKQCRHFGHPFADGDLLRTLPFTDVAIDAVTGTLIFI
jgi:hypothetical protein